MNSLEAEVSQLLHDSVPERPRQLWIADVRGRVHVRGRRAVLAPLSAGVMIAALVVGLIALRARLGDGSQPAIDPTQPTGHRPDAADRSNRYAPVGRSNSDPSGSVAVRR